MAAQAQRDPLVIDAGALRHKITVQAKSNVPDATTGAPSSEWATVLTCMAKLRTMTQREVYQSGQIVGQVTHEIAIRWPGASIAIAGGMRVLFGARTFLIQTPENVQERNRVLLLHCLEINGAV